MDVKDSRTETALNERNNDGSKYVHGSVALQSIRNKSYPDIGHNPLAKAEPTPVRPCAVIGPDRVVPPPTSNEPFLKKGSLEPWQSPDNLYRRPPEYPHKLTNQNPSRNISPRQTFQENMQRIMVPPTYNVARHSDEANFNHIQDRNIATSKNVKQNMAQEVKYCDVPYAINTLANEPMNIRDTEMYVPSVNSPLTRTASHGWPPSSVNVHPPRAYGAQELYQYPQYSSCAGQRPTVIPMSRPHRAIQEDTAFGYPDPHYYQDAGTRFKPYPPVKERYPQPRYEYIGNYPGQFHPPPPIQAHKYDITKSGSSHPYPMYPHLKYLENRVPEHTLEGYQRPVTNQQLHYNLQLRNQVIHPTYAPVSANSSQNKIHPYPSEGSVKTVASNKLHLDNSSKMYIDYENARSKTYPTADNYFVNEMGRVHPVKNQMVMPNYSSIGVHPIPPQQYYRKDNSQMKPFEYIPHFRNFEPHLSNSTMLRHAPQFSPNTLAISADTNVSNDTSQTHGTSQEDFGYVSQSSTASLRSIDSSIYRLPHEYYKRYDFRCGPIVGSSPTQTKSDLNSNNINSKDKKQKQIDVRQFLQMWNEGEEENNCENNNSKEIVIQTGSGDMSILPKQHLTNQDQLYVLGLVNVPSEELSKYEHIQKISKLPENIKGYNSLELLSQFEEAIESSNTTGFKSISKEYQMPSKDNTTKIMDALLRPLSPLDVEAKISQSVIHKEVGCNFEIRPCSPKMLNVEVAAPAQNILGERVIEKVTNPHSKIVRSPIPVQSDENSNCHTIKRQDNTFTLNDNPSCKMIRSPYATNNMDSVKANYSLQDLEINSGVCLASLPRLDNEIELNFPEVNQQFINANKKDSTSTVQNCSLSNLVEESGSSDSKLVKINVEKDDIIVDNSDKTFTKLSKYRKSKVNMSDHTGKNQLTKAVRTDSVIIKNPENIKNIEDKLLENSHNVPINLSSQSSVCHELINNHCENSDVDIALDFSLNKTGSDLPVTEIEKDELTKSLEIHLPHNLCEDAPSTDSGETCNKSANIDNVLCDSNDNLGKCITNELNINNTCSKTNQEVKRDTKVVAKDDKIKSVDAAVNVTGSNNLCSDSLKSNIEPENQHIHFDSEYVNNVKETCDSLEICKDNECVDSKKYNTDEHTKIKDSIRNKSRPVEGLENRSDLMSPHIETVLKCKKTGEMQRSEDENVVGTGKAVIYSQNDNDFEHDEISASLEKLFQEGSEDSKALNTDNASLDVSLSMPPKTLCYQQSKELYSPWIQKLLMHSEGICSNIENESNQKECETNISHSDEYKPMQISTNMFIAKQSQNMDIDYSNKTSSFLRLTEPNESFNEKTKENITSDIKCSTKCESYVTNCLHNAVTDAKKYINVSKHVNLTQNKKVPLDEIANIDSNELSIEKSTNKWNKIENCKTNSEFNVEARKSDVNAYKLNTLQKSVNELLNCDSAILSIASLNNKCAVGDSCETLRGKKCDKEDATMKDLSTPVLENGTHISSNTKQQIEAHIKQKCLKESSNAMINNYKDPDSSEVCSSHKVHENKIINQEKFLVSSVLSCDPYKDTDKTSDILLDSSNIILENRNNSDPQNLTNSVSENYTDHQTKEHKSGGTLIKSDLIKFQNNNGGETSGIIDSTSILQADHNLDSKRFSTFANDNCTEHHTKETQSVENIIENVIDPCDNDTSKIVETLNSSNIIQENQSYTGRENSSVSVYNNCAEYQTQNRQGRDKIINIDPIADRGKTVELFENCDVLQEHHNNPGLKRLSESVSDTNVGYNTKQNPDKEKMSEIVVNKIGKILGTFNGNKVVQENHDNAAPESLFESISDSSVEYHTKDNLCGENKTESFVTKNCDNNIGTTLGTLDRNKIVKEPHDNLNTTSLFKCVSGNCDEYQTKANLGGDKPSKDSVIENGDNDTGTLLETFDSKINFQENNNNPRPESLSKQASDNHPNYQNNENESEETVIEKVSFENNDNDTVEIFQNANINKIYETGLDNRYNLNHPHEGSKGGDSFFSGCPEQHNENQKEVSLILNFITDRDTEKSSNASNNATIICKDDKIHEDQNDVTPESLSNIVFGNNNCTENRSGETLNGYSVIENMSKDCDKISETFDDSNCVQTKRNFGPESISQDVSDVLPAHLTKNWIEHGNNYENNKNEVSDNLDNSNIVCTINDSNLASLSNNAIVNNCTENQISNESRERLTKNVIKILDSNTAETETLGCSNIRSCFKETQDELVDSNLKCLSNSIFDKFNTEKKQSINDLETKVGFNNTENNTVVSSVSDSPKKSPNPDSLIQEKEKSCTTLGNLPNCVIDDKWNQYKKETTSLLNETDIATQDDNRRVQCKSNTKNLCYRKEENYEMQLENDTSNTESHENSIQSSSMKSKPRLKRSFSDSALNSYKNKNVSDRQITENTLLVWSSKRPRMHEFENCEQHASEENLCSDMHNNRRNSVSSFYNSEDVSFCILIDNDCIITEENEEEKTCFAEISEDCITKMNSVNEDDVGEIICCSQESELDFTDSIILGYESEQSIQESWLDDVACVETVVSDNIEGDGFNSPHISPRNIEVSEFDECGMFNSTVSEYTDGVNFTNDETVPSVCSIEETYTSPHTDVRTMLYNNAPHDTDLCNVLYSSKCLEKILSESNSREGAVSPARPTRINHTESILLSDDSTNAKPENKENIFVENLTRQSFENYSDQHSAIRGNDRSHMNENTNQTESSSSITCDYTVQSSESSTDAVFSYMNDENVDSTTSSSPEVSSTTFEEKSSSILLKITNYNGSRVSEINEINRKRPRCKFTEEKEYSNPNGSFPKRPLLTKAAQKYIPPLKETICDLKVKLPLPQHRLLKLKQLKLSINKPKEIKQNNPVSKIPTKTKPKPNFEDVLKNIDEIQFKKHKEKNKRGKNIVPKVVIKKNVNGSHYTSSSNKDTFNPDLTGRKWQPWVFLEKNRFIDNMATNNKTKAIFSHRKKMYVFAEKFKKYKSVSNSCSAKFVISQPKSGNSSKGQLKYTIRLKHTY